MSARKIWDADPGIGSALMDSIRLVREADRLLDELTYRRLSDDKSVAIASEALRQAYNRGILVALDLLSERILVTNGLQRELMDAMIHE